MWVHVHNCEDPTKLIQILWICRINYQSTCRSLLQLLLHHVWLIELIRQFLQSFLWLQVAPVSSLIITELFLSFAESINGSAPANPNTSHYCTGMGLFIITTFSQRLLQRIANHPLGQTRQQKSDANFKNKTLTWARFMSFPLGELNGIPVGNRELNYTALPNSALYYCCSRQARHLRIRWWAMRSLNGNFHGIISPEDLCDRTGLLWNKIG